MVYIIPSLCMSISESLTIVAEVSDVRKNRLAIYTAACNIYCCITSLPREPESKRHITRKFYDFGISSRFACRVILQAFVVVC